MITVERFDALKEAMNASYIPGQASQVGTDKANHSDFMQTLEKNSPDDTVNINAMEPAADNKTAFNRDGVDADNNRKAEQNQKTNDNTNDTTKNTSKDPAKDKTGNPDDKQAKEKAEGEKNGDKVGKDEKKAQDQSEKSTQKNEDDKNTGKSGNNNNEKTEGKYKESASMKDLLHKHGIKEEDLGEVKTEVKEKGAEAKAKASADTAEKLVFKSLNTDDKGQSAKTANSSNDNKNVEELDLGKKLMQNLDPDKKAESAFVKEELRVQKPQPKQNGDNPAFNLLHESPKQTQPLNDIKVKQTLTNHQLLEQYEVLRDRINENVENGIKFLLTNKGESKVSIQLKPPELGKVQMELVIKDNQVSARINTENTAVKEVIMSNLDQLKTNLAQAGHTIDKFDVEVGGFKNHFDQQFGNNKSGGNGNGNGKGNGNGSGHEGEADEAMRGKVMNHRAVSYYLGQSINVII